MEDVLILSDDRKTVEGVKDTSITHVIIPEGIEIIGADSFNGCKSLQSISLPWGIKAVNKQAF